MLERSEEGYNVALTADVPKVARVAGLGVVKLAQYSGRPIYAVAIATSRRIELDNWDRTAINLPFGRIAMRGERTDFRRARRRRRRTGSGAARVRRRAQSRDGARLRDRRPQARRQAVSEALPAALRAYRLLSAAAAPLAPLSAGAAARARQGTRRAAGRAARTKRNSRARRARWSGCMAPASANWPASCR